MTYLWIKSFHLLFVMAWVATAFYLPRILINLAETRAEPAVQTRLVLMGRRLYGFGHTMFGIAVVLGLVLLLGNKFSPSLPNMVGDMKWIHAKLGLVALLFAHYLVCGRWLKHAAAGGSLPSPTMLRVVNEVPVFLLLGIIFLVIAKPF
jgi:protoporphyrinogen IX oxidase